MDIMTHLYPETVEGQDALKVDEAIGLMLDNKVKKAERLLTQVTDNAPKKYIYEYHDKGTIFIKFWNQQEFEHYITWQQVDPRQIQWVRSAYPRAYYYYGYLQVKQQKYESALELLEAGSHLEPNKARFLLEKAQAHIGLRQFKEAWRLCDAVGELSLHVPLWDKALALRTKGFISAELGKLDRAEKLYTESLYYEPVNEVALNELQYISSLESGRSPIPSTTVVTNTQLGTVGQETKVQWWEFWK